MTSASAPRLRPTRTPARPGPVLGAQTGLSHAFRLLIIVAVGLPAGVITGLAWRWAFAPLVGWAAGALAYEARMWILVGRLDAERTREHAIQEDPGRAVADVLILAANVGSLGAVGAVILYSSDTGIASRVALGALALGSVAISWVLVQTIFTLRYARLYYNGQQEGGIKFNSETESPMSPKYSDFAYFAFNMGMTYQVSDTDLTTSDFRAVVLRHALLSYLFGTGILATAISLVVGLSGG